MSDGFNLHLNDEALAFYDFVVRILNEIQKYSVILLVILCLVLYILVRRKKIPQKILQWTIRFGIGVLLSQSGLIQIAVSMAASRSPQILEPFMPLVGYLILLWIKNQI